MIVGEGATVTVAVSDLLVGVLVSCELADSSSRMQPVMDNDMSTIETRIARCMNGLLIIGRRLGQD